MQASGREHLRELLSRASGGVVFTTIQKFLAPPERGSVTRSSDETSNAAEHSDANDTAECSGSQSRAPSGKMPELSARQTIVVIADEAHRSQYGFGGKVNEKTGEMSFGFASNLRDALAHDCGSPDSPVCHRRVLPVLGATPQDTRCQLNGKRFRGTTNSD